jgi:hypothetical protein
MLVSKGKTDENNPCNGGPGRGRDGAGGARAGRGRRRTIVQEMLPLPFHRRWGEEQGRPRAQRPRRPPFRQRAYNYSDANKNSGIVWGEATFKEYIKDPRAKIPGTKMIFPGIKNETEIGNLWAYLKQFGPDGKKK